MKDQLSALIDGELEIESSEHIITSAKSGGELREAWQHYHLIGDALRGDIGRGDCQMRCDFSSRVLQALETEPTVLAVNRVDATEALTSAKTKYKTPFFKSTKVWSVAASVAAVMFVGLILLQHQFFSQSEDMSPVEIAQNLPVEYLAAHQSAAPSSAAYYIQAASFSGAESQK
jgi:sigma-E factor negative regulatory protein RseA